MATPSGEFVIFLLAVPALASPLILLPMPDGWLSQPFVLRPFVSVCMYPRVWAAAATLVACLWILGAPAAGTRKAIAASIALLAWIAASHTASTMAAWDRF